MLNALILIGGIALVSTVIVFLDWWGRRKDRQTARHTR